MTGQNTYQWIHTGFNVYTLLQQRLIRECIGQWNDRINLGTITDLRETLILDKGLILFEPGSESKGA